MRHSLGMQSRASVIIVGLALFVACFTIPLYLGIRFHSSEVSTKPINEKRSNLISRSFQIAKKGVYLEIEDSGDLNPPKNKDYLLTAWFRLKHLPKNGNKMILISKLSSVGVHKEGFVLAIKKEFGEFRPIVFWGDKNGKGGWLTFSEIKISPNSWFMLSLSFLKQQHLGVYGNVEVLGKLTGAKLLGGYRLETSDAPQPTAAVIVGAYKKRSFRGEVGPLGIFAKSDIDTLQEAIMRDFSGNPEQLSSQLDPANVKLWVVGEAQDKSRYQHQVRHVTR